MPETATVYVRKNELDPVGASNNLRGLAAKIKFLGETVPQNEDGVKQQFSISPVADGEVQQAAQRQDPSKAE